MESYKDVFLTLFTITATCSIILCLSFILFMGIMLRLLVEMRDELVEMRDEFL